MNRRSMSQGYPDVPPLTLWEWAELTGSMPMTPSPVTMNMDMDLARIVLDILRAL